MLVRKKRVLLWYFSGWIARIGIYLHYITLLQNNQDLLSKLLWLTGVACGKNIRIMDKIALDSVVSGNNYCLAISCVMIFVLPLRPFWRGGRGRPARKWPIFAPFRAPAGLAGEARWGPDHDAGDFREFGGGKTRESPPLIRVLWYNSF